VAKLADLGGSQPSRLQFRHVILSMVHTTIKGCTPHGGASPTLRVPRAGRNRSRSRWSRAGRSRSSGKSPCRATSLVPEISRAGSNRLAEIPRAGRSRSHRSSLRAGRGRWPCEMVLCGTRSLAYEMVPCGTRPLAYEMVLRGTKSLTLEIPLCGE
jgi:hypothetical protein